MVKRRATATIEEKQTLRIQKKKTPNMSNKQLKAWFQQTFNKTMSEAWVSVTLSRKNDWLDGATPRAGQKRNQSEQWPELEDALFAWVLATRAHIPVAYPAVRMKAKEFWTLLPMYDNEKMPNFGGGWIHKFSERCNLRLPCLMCGGG